MSRLTEIFRDAAANLKQDFVDAPVLTSLFMMVNTMAIWAIGGLGHLVMVESGLWWDSSTNYDDNMRRLTPGEVDYARRVFGDEIVYDAVRIASRPNKRFGLRGQAWQNNIQMFFPTTCDDYGADDCAQPIKAVFMHEMTHIWQNQTSVRHDNVKSYDYTLALGAEFTDLFREHQAEVVLDYTEIFLREAGKGCDKPDIYDKIFYDTRNIPRVVYEQFPAAKAYCDAHKP